jgi:hypothetical protein
MDLSEVTDSSASTAIALDLWKPILKYKRNQTRQAMYSRIIFLYWGNLDSSTQDVIE